MILIDFQYWTEEPRLVQTGATVIGVLWVLGFLVATAVFIHALWRDITVGSKLLSCAVGLLCTTPGICLVLADVFSNHWLYYPGMILLVRRGWGRGS